jgi:hypothetical protein
MKLLLLRRKPIISVGLFVLVAMLAFIAVNGCFKQEVKANDQPLVSGKESVYVSSIEEATNLAGFIVAAPDNKLMQLNDADFTYSIDVNQLAQTGEKQAPYFVGQTWLMSDGTEIRIIQSPCFKLPNIGEQITINGVKAERVFFKAEGKMSPSVAFYWTDGNVGYSLFGTLSGNITEDMLIKFAGSIAVK